MLSPSTWQRDLAKRETYADLGVGEYFVFDPTGEYIEPVLQGYRLDWGRYEPLAGLGPLAVRTQVPGLDRWVDSEHHLRMRYAATGENLRSAEQSVAKWPEAEAQLKESEVGRRAAEARAERAEARLPELEERLKLSR